jgi:CelD/BcsL family acetyltransferase involved in cellulose biosynthesis
MAWCGTGRNRGFLPFQRAAVLQPLGAPLTDYHGSSRRAGVRWSSCAS